MALTSFSGIFVDSKVNKFYQMNGAVTVNTTIEMEENAYTKSEVVKRDIKRKLIEVIQVKNGQQKANQAKKQTEADRSYPGTIEQHREREPLRRRSVQPNPWNRGLQRMQ